MNLETKKHISMIPKFTLKNSRLLSNCFANKVKVIKEETKKTITDCKNLSTLKSDRPKPGAASLCPSQNITPIKLSTSKNNRSCISIKKPEHSVSKEISKTSAKVLLYSFDKLTQYEHKEILKYKNIYFFGPDAKKSQRIYTDNEGFYIININDHISYRYEILEILGSGSFGQVVKCLDYKSQELVALKILKKNIRFKKSGELEFNMIKLLSENKSQETNLIEFKRKLEFRGHFIIVMELLSTNLYEFLKKNDFKPLSAHLVKRIAVQLLIGINHIHSNNIIHCDLKPENIVLKNEQKSSIRIVDFGSACLKENKFFNYIQSRYYRAPEVLLDSGYNEKIDIWSLGCIIVELLTGNILFPGINELDQLEKIVNILGPAPENAFKSLEKKEAFKKIFDKTLHVTDLRTVLGNCNYNVLDFIENCLKWNPSERISAKQALNFVWIKGDRSRSSSCNSRINH